MATAETTVPDGGRRRARPHLRTVNELAGERHASWLELFFDLIFVLAVSQVSNAFLADLSPGGFVRYLLVTALVWWAWVGYSFYADRFESDEPTYRLLTFAGMLSVAALATFIHGAFGETGAAFALSYAAVRAVLVVLYLRAVYYVPLARELTVRVAVEFGLMLGVWVASAFVAPPARYWMWGAAIVAEMATPFLNSRATARVPIDLTHMPERFGLFTLIVLGEAIVAVTNGLVGAAWRPVSALVAVFGFGIAAAIWWIHFEFVHTPRMPNPVKGARFAFLYSHFLTTVGIVAAGDGINAAIRMADEPALPLDDRVALCGGVAIFLASVAINRVVTRCNFLFAGRLAAAAAILGLAAFGASVQPVVLVALLFGALAVEAYVEARTAARYKREATAEDEEDEVACGHLNWVRESTPTTAGCAECIVGKGKWVHLRLCLTCGHVGCCDSSKDRHATRHFEETGHPLMRSIEPGESWVWCYADETYLAGEWIVAWQESGS
jgi:low temperature requirement protein LtrA